MFTEGYVYVIYKYGATLYKGLECLQIFVSTGGPQIPRVTVFKHGFLNFFCNIPRYDLRINYSFFCPIDIWILSYIMLLMNNKQ
jgi:hypothetical protein